MNVIIPVAGVGTRLKPHTFCLPKPLLGVAGKTILDHVLTPLEKIQVDEIIFVVGFKGEQIKQYVETHYSYPARFIQQDKLLGLGYALNLALQEIDNSPVLIILGDTIVECDLEKFTSAGDYVLGLRKVPDPYRFGIAEIENNRIIGLEEKPSNPKTDLALIGVYYFSQANRLKATLASHVQSGLLTAGEVQFTDALQNMIADGTEFIPHEVLHWYDCGTKDTLLATNAHLLKKIPSTPPLENALLIEPVYVASSVQLASSVIGPNVSIEEGAVIENSVIKNSIIGRDAKVENAIVHTSIIGQKATVQGSILVTNIADSSEIKNT